VVGLAQLRTRDSPTAWAIVVPDPHA
jgi:hypothetical protein